ncbi:hypothetical protein U1Q18_050403 [Sarracenia purpurea var. burkii]
MAAEPIGMKFILSPEVPDVVPEDTSSPSNWKRKDMALGKVFCTGEFYEKSIADRKTVLHDRFAVTEDEIIYFSQITIGQFYNASYCDLRRYRVTASAIGAVLKAMRPKHDKPPRPPISLYRRLTEEKSSASMVSNL